MAGYAKRTSTRARGTVSRPRAERAEVKCGYCQGSGKDRWGLMSVLSNCQVCKGKGTVLIEKPHEKCPVCQGAGFQRNTRLTCLACGGKGAVHIEEDGMQTCPECGGTGKTGSRGLEKYCLKCKGKGKIRARAKTHQEKCPVCQGKGFDRRTRLTCVACRGTGVVVIEEGMQTCPECGGTGKTGSRGLEKYCLKCKGKGKIRAPRSLKPGARKKTSNSLSK